MRLAALHAGGDVRARRHIVLLTARSLLVWFDTWGHGMNKLAFVEAATVVTA
jgi:hypothetical protein